MYSTTGGAYTTRRFELIMSEAHLEVEINWVSFRDVFIPSFLLRISIKYNCMFLFYTAFLMQFDKWSGIIKYIHNIINTKNKSKINELIVLMEHSKVL